MPNNIWHYLRVQNLLITYIVRNAINLPIQLCKFASHDLQLKLILYQGKQTVLILLQNICIEDVDFYIIPQRAKSESEFPRFIFNSLGGPFNLSDERYLCPYYVTSEILIALMDYR